MKRLMIIGLWPDDVVKYCTEKCDCRRYAFDRIIYHRGGRAARERICIPVVDRSGAVTTYLDLPVTLLEAGVVYLRLDDGNDIFLSDTQMVLIANEVEGLLAEHYTLSWALASLRDKLKHYEDAGIPEIMPGGLQTIDRAIETYGKDAQLTKAVEEMSELTKALCKYKECQRKYDNPLNRKPQEVYSNIEEEIADVFIMLVQLLAFFRGRESVSITKIVWDKLDRLKDNLDKEAAKQEGCKDDTPEC